jgi:hypothetical protein
MSLLVTSAQWRALDQWGGRLGIDMARLEPGDRGSVVALFFDLNAGPYTLRISRGGRVRHIGERYEGKLPRSETLMRTLEQRIADSKPKR